jgi:hypothetical protein
MYLANSTFTLGRQSDHSAGRDGRAIRLGKPKSVSFVADSGFEDRAISGICNKDLQKKK